MIDEGTKGTEGSKGTNGAKGSEGSKVAEVTPTVIATNAQVVDYTPAFKAFENSVYDLRGFLRMLDDLELIERSLFRGKEGAISFKARDYATSSIIGLFEDIEKTGLEPTTDQKQKLFLNDLISYLKSLPIVKITLAFAPTNTFLERLGAAISTQVGTKTLIDVLVNEYIVGGAIFEFRGNISKQTLDVPLEQALAREMAISDK